MKKFGLMMVLSACIAMITSAAHAQAAVYGEFNVAKMQNLVTDNILYGVTTGFLLEGPAALHHHMMLDGDLQGEFVHKANFNYDGVAVGPRVVFPLAHGISPFAEFLIGFARIHNPADQSQPSTDSAIQVNGGISKRIAPHLDATVQVGYSQLYAFGGEYNPKNFGVGVIYHFDK